MTTTPTHVSDHPLAAIKLRRLRKQEDEDILDEQKLNCGAYSQLIRELSVLLAYEVMKDLPTSTEIFTTRHRGDATGKFLPTKSVLIPILRSGLVMANGFQEVLPNAHIGHIGIHRRKDVQPNELIEYLVSLPEPYPPERFFIILDVVVSTGKTADRAIQLVIDNGVSPDKIRFVSLIMTREGNAYLEKMHPDVRLFCADNNDALHPETGQAWPGLGAVSGHLFGFKTVGKKGT